MINKLCTFFFFILIAVSGYTQDSAVVRWSVSFSPVSLNVPSSELGAQFGIHYRKAFWGVGAEIAFPFKSLIKNIPIWSTGDGGGITTFYK